ncbi:hypothetical protein Vadar_002239 [Vaccinium darrowii]|uniref:Uncharacterized protein n=1 Tax=Vaccinium darrowii TaxID=229202 RepID=A0ACB7XMJ1_9ERIC|nr:hypothetical protein Vadar_002239 [Vaccinium darrowii]
MNRNDVIHHLPGGQVHDIKLLDQDFYGLILHLCAAIPEVGKHGIEFTDPDCNTRQSASYLPELPMKVNQRCNQILPRKWEVEGVLSRSNIYHALSDATLFSTYTNSSTSIELTQYLFVNLLLVSPSLDKFNLDVKDF